MKIFRKEHPQQTTEQVTASRHTVVSPEEFAEAFRGVRSGRETNHYLEEKREIIISEAKSYILDLLRDTQNAIAAVPDFERSVWKERSVNLEKVMKQVEEGDLQAARVEIANTMFRITSFLNALSENRDLFGLLLSDFPKEKIVRLFQLVKAGKSIIESIDPGINDKARNHGKEWGELIPSFMLSELTDGKVTPEQFESIEVFRRIANLLSMMEDFLVLGIRSNDLPSSRLHHLYDLYLKDMQSSRETANTQ